jgi:predicted dehydrogenase
MIRYAVVGAGWISQEAFMPAVAATGNSRMQAIVSGSPETARQLAAFHGVPEVLDYSAYDALIASYRIDAVYIALPNDLHADYTIRALRAANM